MVSYKNKSMLSNEDKESLFRSLSNLIETLEKTKIDVKNSSTLADEFATLAALVWILKGAVKKIDEAMRAAFGSDMVEDVEAMAKGLLKSFKDSELS
jgi:hypothetical protein